MPPFLAAVPARTSSQVRSRSPATASPSSSQWEARKEALNEPIEVPTKTSGSSG